MANEMDFSHLVKLLEHKQEKEPPADDKKTDAPKETREEQNPLTSLLPLFLQGSNNTALVPLLKMLQTGKLDQAEMLKHFLSMQQQKKQAPPASEFDSYTRLE